MRQPIIAIDGPAGSGKSTVAQRVAQRAGLTFISSGAMYRAVAWLALRAGVAATDRGRLIALAAGLSMRFAVDDAGVVRSWIDGEEVTEALRRQDVGQVASAIATIPEVRAHLVAKQQAYGQAGGVVMEGRDIQTVVFPQAEIKVFLTASPEERARRRARELRAKGLPADYDAVLAEIRARDAQDEARDASPLRAAPDAMHIDTDGRSIDQVVDAILARIDAWRAHPKRSH